MATRIVLRDSISALGTIARKRALVEKRVNLIPQVLEEGNQLLTGDSGRRGGRRRDTGRGVQIDLHPVTRFERCAADHSYTARSVWVRGSYSNTPHPAEHLR
jgi:hypothetical protein